ncbi:MAG: glutamate racemase [Muribaculaceae bacterium]|nr:glutamate racemase [Muribaculaceae bacterium]
MTQIGVFDSGYGGLTILREMRKRLPQYDYLYLGDNARAPYGTRSFDVVLDFTWQAVEELFSHGCRLVILACNTASAKALRTIQQNFLPMKYPDRRVLGVIRPTAEVIGDITRNRHIGVFATPGTIQSGSYTMEVNKLFPDIKVNELACPMFVPLVENEEASGDGADFFVKKYLGIILEKDPDIDTLVLACTHYPLLFPKIRKFAPENIRVIAQGDLVADSLADYLRRHPEIERECSKNGTVEYLTTESTEKFNHLASTFMKKEVNAKRITL